MELQISNLSKTYANRVQALKDVTLTIPPGMFGLLGPNGSLLIDVEARDNSREITLPEP